ncbi:unnamed protein product [Merluccius merluccius]
MNRCTLTISSDLVTLLDLKAGPQKQDPTPSVTASSPGAPGSGAPGLEAPDGNLLPGPLLCQFDVTLTGFLEVENPVECEEL